MSYEKFKLTDDAISQNGVSAAPDKLVGSAQDNKKIFDRLIRNVVKDLINGLVDQLGADNEKLSAGNGGISTKTAEVLGLKTTATVNEALQHLRDIAVVGGIPMAELIAVSQETAAAFQLEGDVNTDEILQLISTHAARHAANGADPITPDMIGAAPSGFGLGNTALVRCTFDEIDTIVGNGLWWVTGGSQLVISGHTIGASLLKQTGEFGSLRTQTLHLFGATTSGAYNYQLMRSLKSTGWGEWEWVNPPMLLGVEYRTTERYNGNPVYAKAIEFILSADTETSVNIIIPHGITGLDTIVRSAGRIGEYTIPFASRNGGFTGFSSWSSTNIIVATYNNSWTSGSKFRITLHYTKTS